MIVLTKIDDPCIHQARNIQNYWDSETIKQFVNKLDEGNDSERPFTATIYSDVPNDKVQIQAVFWIWMCIFYIFMK